MRIHINAALLALAVSVSTTAIASSRNGYRLVFVEMSATKNAESSRHLISYFNAEFPSDTYRCAKTNRLIEIDMVYLSKRPKAITNSLIAKSLHGEKYPLRKLRKALRTYRDSEIDKGFDGLVVFKNEDTHYELTAISSTDNDYERSSKASNQQKLDAKILNALFCGSLGHLPYAYID